MSNLRFKAAMLISKSVSVGMKALRRQASYLPGKLALKICPDFLSYIGRPKTIVAVTGTNGKTTVSNMITSVLTANGYSVTNNGYGSNIDAGVTSTLIEYSTFTGRPKRDLAVLEVDERSSLRIYPHLKPDYVVCTNIMRDSIKRNANTDFISYIISSALPASAKLILNGDDIICSALGSPENARVYFGVSCMLGGETSDNSAIVKDIAYCPSCGAELKCKYLRYNHIGRVYCPSCGFASPEPDYCVTSVDTASGEMTVSQRGIQYQYRLVNDNIANIYNTAAAIALLDQLGLNAKAIADGLEKTKIVSSRFDREICCGKTVTLQLAKSQNPIACSRAFDYMRKTEGNAKTVILMIDDIHDNTNNTENICWMYDCDYSPFTDPSVSQIVIGGPRCRDHVLRAMLDGVDISKIVTADTVFETVGLADVKNCDSVFILYDLYLVNDAKKVKNMITEKIREVCAQ